MDVGSCLGPLSLGFIAYRTDTAPQAVVRTLRLHGRACGDAAKATGVIFGRARADVLPLAGVEADSGVEGGRGN